MRQLKPLCFQKVRIRDRVETSPVKSFVMARTAFTHDAVVAMRDGGSPNALGGVIANALCGGWDHQPPCPLAPHYVSNVTDGETVSLRVVFATEPAHEQRVRALIGEALASGQLTVPDGGVARWELRSASPGTLRADEADLAADLIAHS
jgi:hypothetical protein